MNKFFCKTCVCIKQVKYIFKIPTIKAKVPGEIIHIDLVGSIISTEYDGSKYGQHLIDDVTCATMSILLKIKSQVKVEFLKYTENMQIQ